MQMGNSLMLALAITSIVLVVELTGGFLSNSLALLGDAGHVLSDLISFALAYLAFSFAMRPPSESRSFGYHRLEVLAALANGLLLIAISLALLIEAYFRFASPAPVNVGEMLVVALFGLLANLYVASKLHGHSGINARSAFLHAASDALTSVGVIVGAILIAATGNTLIDPALTVLISLAIIYSAYRVVNESLHILSESCPIGVSSSDVCRVISAVPGVKGVHDVHIWCLCSDITYMTAHVVVDDDMRMSQADGIREKLGEKLSTLGLSNLALQFETGECKGCKTCH